MCQRVYLFCLLCSQEIVFNLSTSWRQTNMFCHICKIYVLHFRSSVNRRWFCHKKKNLLLNGENECSERTGETQVDDAEQQCWETKKYTTFYVWWKCVYVVDLSDKWREIIVEYKRWRRSSLLNRQLNARPSKNLLGMSKYNNNEIHRDRCNNNKNWKQANCPTYWLALADEWLSSVQRIGILCATTSITIKCHRRGNNNSIKHKKKHHLIPSNNSWNICMSRNRNGRFDSARYRCVRLKAKTRQPNVVKNSKCDWNINEVNPHPYEDKKVRVEYFTHGAIAAAAATTTAMWSKVCTIEVVAAKWNGFTLSVVMHRIDDQMRMWQQMMTIKKA